MLPEPDPAGAQFCKSPAFPPDVGVRAEVHPAEQIAGRQCVRVGDDRRHGDIAWQRHFRDADAQHGGAGDLRIVGEQPHLHQLDLASLSQHLRVDRQCADGHGAEQFHRHPGDPHRYGRLHLLRRPDAQGRWGAAVLEVGMPRTGGVPGRGYPMLPVAAEDCVRHDHSGQYMCCPPLMLSVDPVTNAASSEQRKDTPRAISSALPSRPTGILATIFSSTSFGTAATMSVSM